MQTVKKKSDLDLDLLTSGSVHPKVLPWTIDLPSLVSTALADFLLQCGQTNQLTEETKRSMLSRWRGIITVLNLK